MAPLRPSLPKSRLTSGSRLSALYGDRKTKLLITHEILPSLKQEFALTQSDRIIHAFPNGKLAACTGQSCAEGRP
jgi:hypothetical protein